MPRRSLSKVSQVEQNLRSSWSKGTSNFMRNVILKARYLEDIISFLQWVQWLSLSVSGIIIPCELWLSSPVVPQVIFSYEKKSSPVLVSPEISPAMQKAKVMLADVYVDNLSPFKRRATNDFCLGEHKLSWTWKWKGSCSVVSDSLQE